jgi:hypothetical protein
MLKRVPLFLAVLPLCFSGCQTTQHGATSGERERLRASIAAEAPGDYYIGRRYYKRDYKFWGWVRRPQQPWSTAQLVMMNEQEKLAPDRAQNMIGSDNNYEYKLYGDFSDQQVYEPASNGFYPEFNLKNYELITVAPLNIYKTPGATDPMRRVIAKPY